MLDDDPAGIDEYPLTYFFFPKSLASHISVTCYIGLLSIEQFAQTFTTFEDAVETTGFEGKSKFQT